ncbi:hypothetical protein GPX89_07060 [Nocardia sp. ET3-3]|uniref:TIGR03767 family metallophosphoesterase n=1 Tax=Nocardia terrae TaxID=2675851 RepID=A0A7K1URN0_9NOCA|nr:hypothetical protein [Nocardia terrae]MVU77005.1 hypothetical protein [Nocardia terrae]
MTSDEFTLAPAVSGSYSALTRGPGEPHLERADLAPGRSAGPGPRLARFVQMTDFQIADPFSPGRLTFLHHLAGRPGWEYMFPAYRPQEPLILQAVEAAVRSVREIGGIAPDFVVTTGDSIDSAQANELTALLALLDGGTELDPNFGVTDTGWHPAQAISAEFYSPEPESRDVYKKRGFPDVPGLLAAASRPFVTEGLGVPWLGCFGNHDCLVQGRAPLTPEFQALVTGDRQPIALGMEPPDDPMERYLADPTALSRGPSQPISPRADRRVIGPAEYVRAHLDSPTQPPGHGFTEQNLADGTTYYCYDAVPGLRMIVLDSTHPAGHVTGSIGARQRDWLIERLAEVHSSYLGEDGVEVRTGNTDRVVVLASHHGLTMMNNTTENAADDEQRYHAADLEALVHRFGNVVLWLAGHEHRNSVVAHPRAGGGFWHVLTSGLCEWPAQTRSLEISLPEPDSTGHLLAIRSTMIDHAAPAVPGPDLDLWDLAAWHRELSYNEPTRVGGPHSAGTPADRNADLLVPISPALAAALRAVVDA